MCDNPANGMEQLPYHEVDGMEDTSNDGGTEVLGDPETNCAEDNNQTSKSDDNQHGGFYQEIEVGEASRDEVVHDDNVQCNQHKGFLQIIMIIFLCQRQLALSGSC